MCQSDRRGFCFVIVAQVVFAGGSLQAQDAALAKQVTSFKRMASKALLASGVVNPPVSLAGWVGAIESAGQTEAELEADDGIEDLTPPDLNAEPPEPRPESPDLAEV